MARAALARMRGAASEGRGLSWRSGPCSSRQGAKGPSNAPSTELGPAAAGAPDQRAGAPPAGSTGGCRQRRVARRSARKVSERLWRVTVAMGVPGYPSLRGASNRRAAPASHSRDGAATCRAHGSEVGADSLELAAQVLRRPRRPQQVLARRRAPRGVPCNTPNPPPRARSPPLERPHKPRGSARANSVSPWECRARQRAKYRRPVRVTRVGNRPAMPRFEFVSARIRARDLTARNSLGCDQ